MKRIPAAILLLAIQLALVASIAAKYLYERHARPRVWAQVNQYDPDQPLRGRYLALRLLVDSCALPHDEAHFQQSYIYDNVRKHPGKWQWDVILIATSGKLVPALAERTARPEQTVHLSNSEDKPCQLAAIEETIDFFIPDTAHTPFPLPANTTLWAEVTVPAEGPPRPIQLALSGPSGFHLLSFR